MTSGYVMDEYGKGNGFNGSRHFRQTCPCTVTFCSAPFFTANNVPTWEASKKLHTLSIQMDGRCLIHSERRKFTPLFNLFYMLPSSIQGDRCVPVCHCSMFLVAGGVSHSGQKSSLRKMKRDTVFNSDAASSRDISGASSRP